MMKHYLLLTTVIASIGVLALPSYADTRYITTTTTHSYDFPDSDPLIEMSVYELSSCPPIYHGGGGGENNGGGTGGYRDSDGDGISDTHTDGGVNDRGGQTSGEGQSTGSPGGGTGRGGFGG